MLGSSSKRQTRWKCRAAGIGSVGSGKAIEGSNVCAVVSPEFSDPAVYVRSEVLRERRVFGARGGEDAVRLAKERLRA